MNQSPKILEDDPLVHARALAAALSWLQRCGKLKKSTEPEISDCVYRSPASQLMEQARQIEQLDAVIDLARQALSDFGMFERRNEKVNA